MPKNRMLKILTSAWLTTRKTMMAFLVIFVRTNNVSFLLVFFFFLVETAFRKKKLALTDFSLVDHHESENINEQVTI